MILLDCCAGAASATFPNGKSITETISASSWDAIAPDPGRYSFTNALIEVLGEWRLKTFSAAMLHAEVLARLKHPRPILINGKRFEARSTPVHFMMTSDHRAPSIEMSRLILNDRRPPSPPRDTSPSDVPLGRGPADGECYTEPNEDKPHVMISLALEDNQRLDLNAWEQWLASFPALAKYVKVQGVFKSHSTLLLLSMPVTVWDLLPDDQACSFVAFIRSNNLVNRQERAENPLQNPSEMIQSDRASVFSGTTFRDSIVAPSISSPGRPQTSYTERGGLYRAQTASAVLNQERVAPQTMSVAPSNHERLLPQAPPRVSSSSSSSSYRPPLQQNKSTSSFRAPPLFSAMSLAGATLEGGIVRQPLLNQSRNAKRTVFSNDQGVPESPRLAAHIVSRLQDYFRADPNPSDGTTEYYASHLGIEATDVKVSQDSQTMASCLKTNPSQIWFHHRRIQEQAAIASESSRLADPIPEIQEEPQMILAGHLDDLLDIFTPAQILFLDLRSPSEFQRSHIHGAVNLRMPPRFLSIVSLDMLDRTFPDEQSRRSFTRWSKTKCVVMYDRNVETLLDCPTASELLSMLRREGWPGRCFVLKGPFREFSISYDKFITGDRMTKEAKKYADSLRSATPTTEDQLRRTQARYEDWLRRIQHEVGTPTNYPKRELSQKKIAVDEHLRELEVEFGGRFPELYKKMKEMDSKYQQQRQQHQKKVLPPPSQPPPPPPKHGKDAFYDDDSYFETRKAHLVSSLTTGLEKMREAGTGPVAGQPGAGYSFPNERVPDKLGELPSPDYDDYDEIDPREAQQQLSPGGRSSASGSVEAASSLSGSGGTISPLDYAARRVARDAQHKQGLWKRLRSNNGK